MYPASAVDEVNMLASPSKVALSGEVKLRHIGSQNTSVSGSTPVEQIRDVIADDHPVARQGLSAILGSLDNEQVVSDAADGEEAWPYYFQYSPDALFVES